MFGSSSQYSSRSFDETSALFPIDTKLESPSPRASACFEQREAERAALRREREPACRRAPACERRVETRGRRRDAEAVRPDEARAVRANEREQLVLPRALPRAPVSAKPAEMTQSAFTPVEAPTRAASSTCSPGTQMTARSTRPGTSSIVRIPGHAADRLGTAVDRVRGSGEVGGQDVAEELAADRAATRRRADDRDRARREERPQRCRDRDVVALVAALAARRGGDASTTSMTPSWSSRGGLEPGVVEDPEHRAVLGSTSATNSSMPRRRLRREALEQAGADAVAVQLVGDRERDLGAGRVAKPHIRGERNGRSSPSAPASSPSSEPRLDQSVSSAPATVP